MRHLTVLIALALTAIIPPLRAGTDAWKSLGPEGGDVRVLGVDPKDPRVLYAASDGVLFKSTDGAGSAGSRYPSRSSRSLPWFSIRKTRSQHRPRRGIVHRAIHGHGARGRHLVRRPLPPPWELRRRGRPRLAAGNIGV